MNHIKNFSWSGIAVIFLSFFIIFNPNSNLDILSFLLIGFIILQKIFSEYFILVLLALRPTLDYWRDYNIFYSRFFDFNINAAISLFLLIWSIVFFVRNYELFKKIPLKLTWIAFLIWCGSSILYTYNTSSTIVETLKLTSLFCLFGICYIMSIKNKDRFQSNFLKAIIAGALIPISLGIYQLVTKTGMVIDEISNRIYGTFAHPNVLATFALLLLIVLIQNWSSNPLLRGAGGMLNRNTSLPSFLGGNKNKNSWLTILTIATLLLIITFTYTRIAWIGVVLLLLIVGLAYYRKALFLTVSAVLLLYGLFYPTNRYLINNFNINLQSNSVINRLTARNQDYDSIAWRTDLASKIIPLFQKKYLVGYGYGTFPNVWDDNKDIQNIWDNTSEAHNDYIKIALESGIIGLILFLSIFASLLYKQIIIAFKTNFKNIVFLTSVFIYLVLSLSDNMLHHTPVIWWFWATWGMWSYKIE